jgi:hypothetical protein
VRQNWADEGPAKVGGGPVPQATRELSRRTGRFVLLQKVMVRRPDWRSSMDRRVSAKQPLAGIEIHGDEDKSP